VDDRGHEESLVRGKIYRVLRPKRGDQPQDLRVVDEEREDYLYPARRFVPVTLPPKAQRVIAVAAPV
jgi:hypothetical protein